MAAVLEKCSTLIGLGAFRPRLSENAQRSLAEGPLGHTCSQKVISSLRPWPACKVKSRRHFVIHAADDFTGADAMIFKLCAAILTAVALLTSGAAAVNLQHCGPDQPLEAIENRAYDVTCDDINLSLTNTVIWEWRTANGSTYRRQCSVTNVTVCERAGDGASPLVRGSDSSQLEIRNVSRDMFGNATVWCWALGAGDAGNSSDNCQMDVIRDASSTTGDASSTTGDARSTTGDARSTTGDASSTTGDARSTTGDARSTTGDASSTTGDASSTTGDARSTTGDASSTTGDARSTTGDASSTTGNASSTTGDASSTTVDDQEYTTSRDPSSLYASGTCNYSTQLRVTSATYRYFVVITPGAVSASAGSITVERPTGEPTVTCDTSDGMWVVEGQDITCSCNVSSLGQPAGRLVGYINTTDGSVNHVTTGDYGASEVKLISGDITRQAGEVVVTCHLEWVTPLSPDLTASVSISVAYGPDDVTINDPGELYVNPNVATTVEFTCNTSSSKPQVSVTWSGPPCAGQTGSTCRVTLTPDLHLNNITCNATNSITQVARSALRTLSLKYPPPSRPTITGYEGQPLYTGQSLEMTCTVNGGRPSVSGVTFTCDGQGQEVTGQSSIIPLTRLTSSDHGKRCTCSARWGDDSHHAWYNVTSTITLTVYYCQTPHIHRDSKQQEERLIMVSEGPASVLARILFDPPQYWHGSCLTRLNPPSGLNITYGSQTYPFMVGEIVTLECHAETMGNPPVTLTLQPEGQETGVKSTLTLGPLTVDHNGQSVVCEATNNYTQWSNQPLVERFRLNVYYRPVISLSRLHQDQCRFPVDDDTVCILTEGQRVNLRCEAHGNPGPLNITWSQTTSDVLDVQVDRDTPTAHRCDVNTARVTGDNRLPLNTSLVLTVLVTYEGDLSTLTANQHTSSLTIMESQSVNVTCSATGRPTPAVRLSRLIHTHVTSRPPGNVTVDDKVSLTYADNKVTCDKAGLYVCEVTFHQGRRETRNLTLFVNCKFS
ncbi:hypothetical protein BaRGS_00025316 [Batillaria attramentaria]|uniref:Ig-like domain-containing protein n=1 Tax=Batillaria attramentaria TaxID=370345 RepID=A0ABD0K8G9_9CAEN